MEFISEYIKKNWHVPQFENELSKLVKKYNKLRDTYLVVYVATAEKPVNERALNFEDYYVLHDMLHDKHQHKSVDIYLETLGGIGEAAEDIVGFLRNNFDHVNFLISGQAKSAGTILALSGDEIFMTETGGLGPIDAQIKIGRAQNSSYDYIKWVEEKREEAGKNNHLNPFDATIVAQITPGELQGVYTTHKYAVDLVEKWLYEYKFKNWTETETKKIPVTPEMRRNRANEIATELTNRGRWKTHGKSLKIDDLLGLGLKIQSIDADPEFADLVYRIQTVCRFILDNTNTIKIFTTEDTKIFKKTHPIGAPQEKVIPVPNADTVKANIVCNNCKKPHKFYIMLKPNARAEKKLREEGILPFPTNDVLSCKCGSNIALSDLRKQINTVINKHGKA